MICYCYYHLKATLGNLSNYAAAAHILQILSMGAGLYMLPMMLPTGMQHMPRPHMSHFSPIGVGMGFGMNMLDMNGGMMQVHPIQGPHYPVPATHVSTSSSFHQMVKSASGFWTTWSRTANVNAMYTVASTGWKSSSEVTHGSKWLANGWSHTGVSQSALSTSSKDGVQHVGGQVMLNSNVRSFINQATKEGIQQSPALQQRSAEQSFLSCCSSFFETIIKMFKSAFLEQLFLPSGEQVCNGRPPLNL
ncbi:ATP-dependent DNA helicase pif3 [Ancistrocladus abbreviatus]